MTNAILLLIFLAICAQAYLIAKVIDAINNLEFPTYLDEAVDPSSVELVPTYDQMFEKAEDDGETA